MIINGDCIEEMQKLIDQGVQVDAVVTDPPYEIGFMGREWDSTGIAYRKETWRLAWELLKPGGHLLAFSASRTYHRMTVAIEDAGFEIRDQMMWLYGSGFPKSHNIGKNVDKTLGNVGKVVGEKKLWGANASGGRGNQNKNNYQSTEIGAVKYEEIREVCNEWEGWGTALKPAHEPIAVGRKPISESTVAKNVLKHGTGGINIDASRVETNNNLNGGTYSGEKRGKDESSQWQNEDRKSGKGSGFTHGCGEFKQPTGRFPANIMHDGSEEVVKLFPETAPSPEITKNKNSNAPQTNNTYGQYSDKGRVINGHNDKGSASRYFYCPKVSKKERGENNKHPTVKPQELMKYLIRMVTPKGGTVLDPFMGSGSTGMAAKDLEFNFIGIEMDEEYFKICQERIEEINPLGEFLE